MKLQSRYIVLTLSVLTAFIFSCMEPYLETSEKNLDYQIQNNKDGYLNLDFEDGLDYWEFNSSRIYSDRSNLIFIEKTDKEAKSGNNSISINIQNQRLTVSRLIDYLPGDSLDFSSRIFIDNDSVKNQNSFGIRVDFLDENFNNLNNSSNFLDDLNTQVWEEIETAASSSNPNAVYAQLKILIFAIDSISMFIDDAQILYNSNYYNNLDSFSLNRPHDFSQFNFGDTTQFSWQKGFTHDSGEYRFDSHLLFEFENLIANSGFEITGVSDCNGQDMYPMQWWIYPYCRNNGVPTNINPYSTFVSDKVSRSGEKALRMQGLYTDSIQNFNTMWQFVSNQDYRTVPPGSKVTFEGYIMTPDSNKISGSNTVEIGIWSFNEEDQNFPNIAPIFNKNFSSDEWHKFSVSAIMPRYRNSNNTQCGIYIRYNQYNHADEVVYLDDLTVKSDKPMRVNFVSNIVSDTILTILPNTYISEYAIWRNWRVDTAGWFFGSFQPFLNINSFTVEWDVKAIDDFSNLKSSNGPFRYIYKIQE